jgi:uncharacterized membrane protein YccC
MSVPRPGARQAEALIRRLGLSYDTVVALRFAINVFIATIVVWNTMGLVGITKPIWAIASMIGASDPEPDQARQVFRNRLINVLVGCACGLAFLLLAGGRPWVLPVALATTVLISTRVVRVKMMWRQAPITVAIVIAAAMVQQSTRHGVEQGLLKVAEVVYGCVVGLLVSGLMSRVWRIQQPPATTAIQPPGDPD